MEKKNILITGKNGFLAKNCYNFFSEKNYNVKAISHDEPDLLPELIRESDIVFHFAAVQRSHERQDFIKGNIEYTKFIVDTILKEERPLPILFTTSTGIDNHNSFSETKLEAERIIREYGNLNCVRVYIFKLNHIFGRFAKPNHNNVIATWCSNLANNIPLIVNDPGTILNLTYVDDLMTDFYNCIIGKMRCTEKYYETTIKYQKTLGEILMYLGFLNNNKNHKCNEDIFMNKLRETLTSYKSIDLNNNL